MQVIKSSNVKEQKPYEPPKLVRQGHVSQVTKKSGLIDDDAFCELYKSYASVNTEILLAALTKAFRRSF